MTALEAAIAAMDHPWRWGTHDCCAAACSAFAALRGFDPMLPLRGTYATGADAADMIEAWGGFEFMTERLAAMSGMRPCAGGPGAIGLAIGIAGPMLVFGVGPDLWAGKTLRGFTLLHRVERAWS